MCIDGIMKIIKKLLLTKSFFRSLCSNKLRNLKTCDHSKRENLLMRKKDSTDEARTSRKKESADVTRPRERKNLQILQDLPDPSNVQA